MNRLNKINKLISTVLEGGDILIVVPPFASNKSAPIGPHLLQTIAKEMGFKTEILYLNLLLTSILGLDFSERLGSSKLFQYWGMLPERLFARSAHGLPALGTRPEFHDNQSDSINGNKTGHIIDYEKEEDLDLKELLKIEKICEGFTNRVVETIASFHYKIVGCSILVDQTNFSISFLNGLKRLNQDTITILGGAGCRGEIAEGIASLSDAVDYVFSGESEHSFADFLTDCLADQLPSKRIIVGQPLLDMETLPLMNYDDFFIQLDSFLGEDKPGKTGIWYETSRGCWWGERRKCTFCGQSEEDLKFRRKSVKKVANELEMLKKKHPDSVVVMSDSIMPRSFPNDLVPILANKKDTPSIDFYCMRINVTLKDLVLFKKAKIDRICPGIETLADDILKLMNKGTSLAKNLLFMRNARCSGVELQWFLLWGLPGDKCEDYEAILKLLPLIRHLQPPIKFICMRIERFSSYFEKPMDYKISNMRPWNVYRMVYPEGAEIDKLAFYFAGEFPSGSFENPILIQAMTNEVAAWQNTWEKTKLVLIPFIANKYIVYDSREQGKGKKHVIDKERAKKIMTYGNYRGTKSQNWALEEKLGILTNSKYVPLITASPSVLLQLELLEE